MGELKVNCDERIKASYVKAWDEWTSVKKLGL